MNEFISQVVMTLKEYNELLEIKDSLQHKVLELKKEVNEFRKTENDVRLNLILALNYIEKETLHHYYDDEGWLRDYKFKEIVKDLGIKNATYLKSKDIRVPVEETTQGE